MTPCASGRHFWLTARDADRCCAGYHRELRWERPDDDTATLVRGLSEPAWWVWVEDDVGSNQRPKQ